MKPHDLMMVRSLVQSLMHTAATLDQILNPEPEAESERKPARRYLGDEDSTTEEPDAQ